ncbi:MAG: hypothetical protein NTY53_14800 [Kiritimatiellaeota bacterium]|nr:hypothetical protein [Kiritimatiellota bacterium]
MRILVLSSLAADSGCYLRARYLAAALRACGHMVTFPRAPLAKPGLLELPLSLLMYLPAIFSRRYEVLLAAKPYPNTLWPLLLKRTLTRHGRVVADVDDIDFGYRSGMGATVLRALQRPWPRRCDLVTYHNERHPHHCLTPHPRLRPSGFLARSST